MVGLTIRDWQEIRSGRIQFLNMIQKSGTYEFTANVDAWDKTLSETDYEGNTYPEDVDKEGAGIVYLITEKGRR